MVSGHHVTLELCLRKCYQAMLLEEISEDNLLYTHVGSDIYALKKFLIFFLQKNGSVFAYNTFEILMSR